MGLTAGVTGQQGMLTPPRHLIPLLVFPGVRVSLIFNVDYLMYLIWTLILTADFSVNLTSCTDSDSGLVRFRNFDTLILTTDFYV